MWGLGVWTPQVLCQWSPPPQPLDAYFCLRSVDNSSRMMEFESWGGFTPTGTSALVPCSSWVPALPTVSLGFCDWTWPASFVEFYLLVLGISSSTCLDIRFWYFVLEKKETALRLRALAALPENRSLVPSTHAAWFTTVCNSGLLSSTLPWVLMRLYTHIHK